MKRKKLLSIVLFIVKLDLLLIPLIFLLQMDFAYEPLQNFLAAAVSVTLKFIGYSSVADGHYIAVTFGKTLEVVDISMDCTGWKSAYALLALAVATPAAWKKRFKFLLTSIPAIFFINYIRIVTTIVYAQKFGLETLAVVHSVLWQEGLVAAVLVLWFLWLWSDKKGIKLLIS